MRAVQSPVRNRALPVRLLFLYYRWRIMRVLSKAGLSGTELTSVTQAAVNGFYWCLLSGYSRKTTDDNVFECMKLNNYVLDDASLLQASTSLTWLNLSVYMLYICPRSYPIFLVQRFRDGRSYIAEA